MLNGRRLPIPTQFSTSWRPPISVPGAGQAPSSGRIENTVRQIMKPDFLKKTNDPNGYNTKLELADAQKRAEVASQSISNIYDKAREQLVQNHPVGGYGTETQRRQDAWKRRDNPLYTARDDKFNEQLNARIGLNRASTPTQQPPSRPNFNGPSRRFGG